MTTHEEPDDVVPHEKIAGILGRAAQLDRDRPETSSVDALRTAAMEAGISLSALDAALAEYAEAVEASLPAEPARPAAAPAAPSSAAGRLPVIRKPAPAIPEKSESRGVLLAVFLGGFGAHRFYLNDFKGFLYLAFSWTLVPSVVGLVEAFFMGDRVREFNDRRMAAVENLVRKLSGKVEERRPCPHCAEKILPDAKVCRFCLRDVTPQG